MHCKKKDYENVNIIKSILELSESDVEFDNQPGGSWFIPHQKSRKYISSPQLCCLHAELEVEFLRFVFPNLGATEAEEGPQVTEDTTIERVLLIGHVFQIRDAVPGHELPRRAVYGGEVKVAPQEDQNDQRKDTYHQ